MMIFFTLFFIFSAVYCLFKGKLFYSTFVESAESEIEKAKGDITETPKEIASKVLMIVLYVLMVLVIQIIYLIKALNIDPYMLPTVGFISYFMLMFIANLGTSKKDLTTDEGRFTYLAKTKKKHSFRGKFTNLVHLTYFGYMLAVLLELFK